MEPMRISCPSCKATLKVSLAFAGKKGRCKQCGAIFRLLAAHAAVAARPSCPPPTRSLQSLLHAQEAAGQAKLESTIVDLAAASHMGLPQADDMPMMSAGPPLRPGHVGETEIMDWLGNSPGDQAAETDEGVSKVRETMVPPPRKSASFPVRLGHVDSMGAFFLFSPSLLLDERFRLSFPQKCAVCGTQASLQVHLVFWPAMLPHSADVGFRTQKEPPRTGGKVVELRSLAGKSASAFLDALGRINVLPEPYCLPFPYYICRLCSPAGAVVTDVRTINQVGQQECELGICSLPRAEEFATAVCGPDCPDALTIRHAFRQRGGDPWQMTPLAVQTRIRKWYRPDKNERFLAFIPDADFARTEDGSAGLVLTDGRILYYRQGNLVDIPLGQTLTIARVNDGPKLSLHILSSEGRHANMVTTAASAEKLRHCLVQQGIKAKWT